MNARLTIRIRVIGEHFICLPGQSAKIGGV